MEYLKLDSTRISLREYWAWKPGLPFIYLAARKLLGSRVDSGVLIPAAAGIHVVPETEAPPDLLAALEPALRACVVAGYRQVFLYNVPSLGRSRGLSAAFLDDRRLSLILVAVAEGAGGAAREVVLGLLSRLEAGGFLSTASSRNLFEIPRSVEAVRVRGKPYGETIAAHERRLLKEKRRVVPLDEAGVVTVVTEVQQLHLDANVARGIYVPASADDVQRCEQSR